AASAIPLLSYCRAKKGRYKPSASTLTRLASIAVARRAARLLMMLARGSQRDDPANQRPDGKRQQGKREAIRLLSNETHQVRPDKSTEIPHGVDHSDAGGRGRAAEEFRRHRPEWTKRAPDANRGKCKRCQFRSRNF